MSHQEKVKLPTLDLPKFDGTYSQWLLFRDTFYALIECNADLENIQKFYYLKSCLLGNAAQLLQSLEMSADNYVIAWDLLKSRFENKRLLIHYHIQGLFEMSSLTRESGTLLRKLIDDTLKHLRALKTLGEPVDNWDSLVIHMIASRLDNATRRKWEASLQDNNVPKLQELIQFLSRQCAILETLQSEKAAPKPQASGISNKKSDSVASHVSQSDSKGCIICQGQHALYSCNTFKSLSTSDRRKEVKRHQLCFNCLRADHMANRCIAGGCKQCGKKHNTLLHDEEFGSKAVTTNEKENLEASTKGASSNAVLTESKRTDISATYSVVSTQSKPNHQVLLATAPVTMYDKSGKPHKCRAFLDAGSQTNIITASLCQRLQITAQRSSTFLSGIGCGRVNTLESTHAVIHSTVNEFKIEFPFVIMERITEPMPSINLDKALLKIPENIEIADASFGTPEDVDILLGSGIFWDLLCIGQIKLGRNLPVLQKTKLGWIVGGNAPIAHGQEETKRTVLSAIAEETELSHQLERFWNLEECMPQAKFSKEDEHCEREFRDTYRRDATGRFVVKLSFREDSSVLGDSRETALKRLRSLHRRLNSNPDLKEQYVSCMEEYISLGHITKVDEEINRRSPYYYYLPHHAVVKKESTTTRLRVVYNASSKTSTGKSLNDILKTGPVLQQDIFVILIRFRQHLYVITGDIEKMYRQVYVDEGHRDLQRIFWMKDSTALVEEFVSNVLIFGMALAVYLAIRCLKQLGYDCQQVLPEISRIILEDFYIDDMITGVDDKDELKNIQSRVSEVLNSGGFRMRKWRSNVSEITSSETSDEQSLGERVKTLGLYWHPTTDTLSYKVELPNNRRITKRSILSFIAHIYDPLGLIGPVCVQAKIILQKLWQLKLNWDESLPADLHSAWLRYYGSLSSLQEIIIPRLIVDATYTKLEIHGFCDASEAASGACLYLVSDNLGVRTSYLICAKSRVAPLKKITLPKLELNGAVLLAKLMDKTEKALKVINTGEALLVRCNYYSSLD
ncbi:uncharacterized protein LOC112466077 [Temnothorax curvispinosus]|uniref:Uncharacterized protein LOC112466077 n=1 Tax=Temnothorax curvispinosus TaxID=300111 RepID=A0A6J1R3U7_9HYME|nr:uncharacterized protein LOC112466077 [Temnothorax curvispinosus]